MRLFLLVTLLLVGCMHGRDDWDEDEQRMRMIERSISLPPSAAPMIRYRRYYAWSSEGTGFVDAVYVLEGESGRFWVAHHDLPIVLHGGCTVIRIRFDVK